MSAPKQLPDDVKSSIAALKLAITTDDEQSDQYLCELLATVDALKARHAAAEARSERAVGMLREARECMESGGCRDGDCAVLDRIAALLKEVSGG